MERIKCSIFNTTLSLTDPTAIILPPKVVSNLVAFVGLLALVLRHDGGGDSTWNESFIFSFLKKLGMQ